MRQHLLFLFQQAFAFCLSALTVCNILFSPPFIRLPFLRVLTKSSTFIILISLLLLVGRLSSLLYNRELDLDESQVITQAITLAIDPLYWKSVDGNTIGPVNSYLLTLPALFRGSITYYHARVLACLLLIATLIMAYKALNEVFSTQVSRFSIWLIVQFLAFTKLWDFLHYSSELPAIFFCTAILWVLMRFLAKGEIASGLLVCSGIAAGLVPYAKLQAVPVAGLLIVVLSISLFTSNLPNQKKINALLNVFAGGIAPTILVAFYCWHFDLLPIFWRYYIIANLEYKNIYHLKSDPLYKQLHLAWESFDYAKEFWQGIAAPFLATTIIGCVCFVYRKRPDFTQLGIISLLGVVSVYVVLKPGTYFLHHLYFLLIPVGLSTAFWLNFIEKSYSVVAFRLMLGFCFFAFLLPAYTAFARYKQGGIHHIDELYYKRFENEPNFQTAVLAEIRKHRLPDDRLAVWGWHGWIYVKSNTPQATRDNHIQRCVSASIIQQGHLERYVTDLRLNRPFMIVDLGLHSTTQEFADSSTFLRHYPVIADYVNKEYVKTVQVGEARFYLRKDRMHLTHSTIHTASVE